MKCFAALQRNICAARTAPIQFFFDVQAKVLYEKHILRSNVLRVAEFTLSQRLEIGSMQTGLVDLRNEDQNKTHRSECQYAVDALHFWIMVGKVMR